MKKIILILIIAIFTHSCGGISDVGKVMRNEKNTNTDEFLVKKRDPLTLPPDYNTLPEPGSVKKSKEENNSKIKKILKLKKNNSTSNNSSSVEQSIINKIRK